MFEVAVKDIDFGYGQILVRDGKGNKDRVTVLPQALQEPLQRHLARVKALHDKDLKEGYGQVYLPDALEKKYPRASREWGWQARFSDGPSSAPLYGFPWKFACLLLSLSPNEVAVVVPARQAYSHCASVGSRNSHPAGRSPDA